MVDPEKLFKLAEQFDNKTTKVLGVVPERIKLSEVVGITFYPDKTTKISISRKGILYLCWVETKEIISDVIRFKQEISEREDPDERWEPWEVFGSEELFGLRERILRSRLTSSEKKERVKGCA